MFDRTPPSTQTATPVTRPWTSTLSRGDVVLFAFPHADEDGGKPKLRPCLVLEVEDILGKRCASLAYGTSADTDANKGYEIRLRQRADYEAAGLDQPTRFVGRRRILVPLTHKGFPLSRRSPVIGRLTGDVFDRMNDVRARLAAEADMRTARREEKRRRATVGKRAFTVERRRKLTLASDKPVAG